MSRVRRASAVGAHVAPDEGPLGPGPTAIPGCAVMLRNAVALDLLPNVEAGAHFSFGTRADFRRGVYRAGIGWDHVAAFHVYRGDGSTAGVYACASAALAEALRLARGVA